MAYTARPNYKRSHDHNFDCCKTSHEAHRYRSKSANPPSSQRPLYSAPISNVKARHVLPFSIQSQQKNTLVLDGPLEESSGTASARGKTNQKSKIFKNNTFAIVFKYFYFFSALRLSVSKVNIGSNYGTVKTHRSNSFRMYFDRGDLPIKMEYLCGGDKIGWTVSITKFEEITFT